MENESGVHTHIWQNGLKSLVASLDRKLARARPIGIITFIQAHL